MSETAKNQYIKDRQYLIDKSSNPDKKKESLGMEFDRRVEQGKIIVDGDNYKFKKLSPEEQKEVNEINKMMEEKFANKKDGGLMKKAKGGMANKKKPAKKSKLAGRLAMRGYGAVIR